MSIIEPGSACAGWHFFTVSHRGEVVDAILTTTALLCKQILYLAVALRCFSLRATPLIPWILLCTPCYIFAHLTQVRKPCSFESMRRQMDSEYLDRSVCGTDSSCTNHVQLCQLLFQHHSPTILHSTPLSAALLDAPNLRRLEARPSCGPFLPDHSFPFCWFKGNTISQPSSLVANLIEISHTLFGCNMIPIHEMHQQNRRSRN